MIIIIIINLCYYIRKGLFVCTAIYSAPGSATVLRSVSLEPVGPDDVQRKQNFPEKWPVAYEKQFIW